MIGCFFESGNKTAVLEVLVGGRWSKDARNLPPWQRLFDTEQKKKRSEWLSAEVYLNLFCNFFFSKSKIYQNIFEPSAVDKQGLLNGVVSPPG